MRQKAKLFALFLLVTIGAASRCALTLDRTVDCDKKESIRKTLKELAGSNPQGPNTISVTGSCRENLVIRSMDRLTLLTRKGASITDNSNGNLVVVDIEDSRSVNLKGFTINGGLGGLNCASASVCYLNGNTIQGSPGTGLAVAGGSHAVLESNVIQNNGARGAFVGDGSHLVSSNDVFQGNLAQGTVAAFGSFFEASNSTFLNNSVGIEAAVATVHIVGGTISGSVGDGMRLLGGSNAVFQGPTITGNGGNGVHLEDGAFAGFLGATITDNLSGTDVDCAPQFPITRFVDRTGGITNCVEEASSSKRKPLE